MAAPEDEDEAGSCEIRTCQRLIEDLTLKMFNIERNLLAEIEYLKEKLEGRKRCVQTPKNQQD